MTKMENSSQQFFSTESSAEIMSNTGVPIQEQQTEIELRLPVWSICVMIVAYFCVFVVGLIGNCSVLIVVLRLSRMQTVTNYFICNLAFADLLVLLFCLLPNLISNMYIRKYNYILIIARYVFHDS